MTSQQLSQKVRVYYVGYGTLRTLITYRGKNYGCYSHNVEAYDRINSDRNPLARYHGMTLKKAYRQLYLECIEKNNLNIQER